MGKIFRSRTCVGESIRRRKKPYSREIRKRSSTTYGHQAWSFSGQSMPLRRMRSGWWLCKTSRVSPSRMETTGPMKSDASTAAKEEMKKHTVDTERSSNLRLRRVYLEVP